MDAIVLAAGKLKDELKEFSNDGTLIIGKKPMVDWVVDALKDSAEIDKVEVVKDNKSEATAGNSIVGTMKKGLQSCGIKNENVLIVSSDIPLITGECIDDFISRCKNSSADVYYPIINKKEVNKRFAGSQRTYVKVKDGYFTGGNLIVANSKVLYEKLDTVADIFSKRKSPFRLVGILGLFFLLKFLLGMLSISDFEKKCSKVFGARCKVITTPYAEIGVDVDKLSDYEMVSQFLS